MENKNISDQKIEALFDQAFDFQAPPRPKFETASSDMRELELSELDMLSAAGEKTVLINTGKKNNPDGSLENK